MLMSAQPPTALASGTHIAFEFAGADHLLELGATNVVHAFASLAVGPSRRDVREHVRARQVWFDDDTQYDLLYSAEVRWEMPVVVWATPCLHDRLNLWKTCSWLRDRGVPRRDVFIIDIPRRPPNPPRTRTPRHEPFDCNDSVVYQPVEALHAHLTAARPWPQDRYEQAVQLWEQYVDPDPRRFARRCLRGVQWFPDLGPLWSFLSRFFPRMNAERSLRISRYDELLFRALSTEWQTPLQVYISDVLEPYWEFFGCVGDLTVKHRLSAWANHDASAAVERAPAPGGADHPMRSHIYRLTTRGVQLRAGLPWLADAPRLPVGGAEAYAPEAPWVLLDDGRLVRL